MSVMNANVLIGTKLPGTTGSCMFYTSGSCDGGGSPASPVNPIVTAISSQGLGISGGYSGTTPLLMSGSPRCSRAAKDGSCKGDGSGTDSGGL
jgi:hypothetical protein